MPRRVLIFTYDFPPSSLGIWRTLKFCRYMPEHGWTPTIITVKDVRSPRYDPEPLKELPPGTIIHRTGSLDPFRLAMKFGRHRPSATPAAAPPPKRVVNSRARAVMDVLRAWIWIPDDKAGWMPFAWREGRRLLAREKFDAIYSTSFPNTTHIAAALCARKSRVPYLADFRDIWIGNYAFYHPATKFHDRLQRRLERMVVHTAARVVTATEPITEDFRRRHPDQPPQKFLTITNGFDSDDFAAIAPEPDRAHFTITYAGTMYGSTSPASFFEAARDLLADRPQFRDVLRIRFIGAMIEPYQRMIDDFGLRPITAVESYLAHDEALRVMAEADALLLIVAPVPGSHIMLTQKVFEYAAARRPILALVPDGAAKDFLHDIGEGIIAPPDQPAPIKAALEKMLLEWQERGRINLPENPRLDKYHRRELTARLCSVLDEIAAH